MADTLKLYPESAIQNIAKAIREKNGSSDTYTVANMAGAIKDISGGLIQDDEANNTTVYPQMNDVVADFINNVSYDTTDYQTTKVTDYWQLDTDYSKEEPFGLNLLLPSNTALTVKQGDKTLLNSTVSGKYTIYNIEPLKTAEFIVDGTAHKITPEGGVRMIYAPSVYNVRDLGGWDCDGGRTKYGKLYRGSEFTGGNTNDITAEDINVLKNWCGIKVDLDLRSGGEANAEESSPLGDGVSYYRYPFIAYAQSLKTTDGTTLVVNAVKKAIESVLGGLPVYFHCVSGADRTGTLSYILLSLLGVSQSDKDKEYELTAFTEEVNGARFRNSNYSNTNGNSWYALVSYFRDNYEGDSDNDKVVAWATANGITAETIKAFRDAMIDGNAGDVVVPKKKFTVTNALTDCSTNNAAESVYEGDSYAAKITAASGYTLKGATVSVKMGGADITATAYDGGTVSIVNVTGDIVITVAAAVYVPNYTNIVRTSLDPSDFGQVFNTTGYMDNARMSYTASGGVYYRAYSGGCCSGFIKVEAGDVYYMKADTVDPDSAYLGGLVFIRCDNGDSETLGNSVYGNGAGQNSLNKWVTQGYITNLEQLGDNYYKFTIGDSAYPAFAHKGMMVNAGGSGANLIVTKNEAIDDDGGGGGAITGNTLVPTAIPEYIKDGVRAVVNRAKPYINEDCVTFLSLSDFHNSGDEATANQSEINTGNLHAAMAAKVFGYSLNLDFVCNLGDMAWGSSSTTEAQQKGAIETIEQYLDEAFEDIPQFWTPGNHDCCKYSLADGLGASYLFEHICSHSEGAIYGSTTAGYCYRDFSDKTLRVICLSTAEDNNKEVMTDTQLLWFANTLNATPSGYNIIVLSHHPLDWGAVCAASNIVYQYQLRGSYNIGGAEVSFANAVANVICAFHGHVHGYRYDKLNYIEDSVGKPYDVYRMATPNACFIRNNEYGENGKTEYFGIEFGETTTYAKTADSENDTALTLNVINPTTKLIYSFTYGAGPSVRSFSYDATAEAPKIFSITTDLSNASVSNAETSVTEGDSYSTAITAADGYELSRITVTMGGVDITSTAVSGTTVTIAAVTGDIVITVVANQSSKYNVTNLVLTSEEQTSTAVYNNGLGYKNGYKASEGGSGAESSAAGYTVTGFIPFTWNASNTIYIRGAELSNDGNARIYGYTDKASGAVDGSCYATGDRLHNSSSNIYFDWEELESGTYYSLTPKNDRPSVTCIRISLKGTGENLIVTINEVIE